MEMYWTKLYWESRLWKVSLRHSNIPVKTKTNINIKHDWQETVAQPTLLPATVLPWSSLCKHASRYSLAATATRETKVRQIKWNRRQSLLNPPKSLKTELRGGLGSCWSYHLSVGLPPCKATGKKGASLKPAVPKDYVTSSLSLDNISSFFRHSAFVCNCWETKIQVYACVNKLFASL